MTPNELSAANPRIRDAAALSLKKHRLESGCILIEGARLVADALDADAGADVRDLFATSDFLAGAAGQRLSSRCRSPITPITQSAAAKLSETRSSQGVFAVLRFAAARLETVQLSPCPLVLVADGVADPGNLGSIIRSAAALAADAVVVTGDSCDVLNPKTVRATMGALFRRPVVTGLALIDAVGQLRSRGLQIVAAVPRGGTMPWEIDLAKPSALLIGSEADGLPGDAIRAADALATVPLAAGTESLNAAACAAALLYESLRQRARAACRAS